MSACTTVTARWGLEKEWAQGSRGGQGPGRRGSTLRPAFPHPHVWSITRPTGGDFPLFPESIHFLTSPPGAAAAVSSLGSLLLPVQLRSRSLLCSERPPPSRRVPTSPREESHVLTCREPQALCDLFPRSHSPSSLHVGHAQPLAVT